MTNSLLGVIKQILTALTRGMVKTTTPSVIPGPFHFPSTSPRDLECSGDHLGSRSVNHSTRSSQYLYTINGKPLPELRLSSTIAYILLLPLVTINFTP